MCHHHKKRPTRSSYGKTSDSEEGVAHVHDRAVTEHHLKVLLCHCDEPDQNDVTQRQPNDPREPMFGTRR